MLSRFRVVGFSGHRRIVPWSALQEAVRSLSPTALVAVGDASGVDAAVRRLVPPARLAVFRVSGKGKSAFARRSIRCVEFVRSFRRSAAWVSFPGQPCPPGLVPSPDPRRCFCGLGSGSWASLALAAGLGLQCFAWLPLNAQPPQWLASIGQGWFVTK